MKPFGMNWETHTIEMALYWSVVKYIIDDSNTNFTSCPESQEEPLISTRLEECVKILKEHVEKYVENYLISLHYLEFPVAICYGLKRVPPISGQFEIISTYIEPVNEVTKMLMSEEFEVIHGFPFIQKNVEVRRLILSSTDQYTFDKRASTSGLQKYVIDDLRTIWKNQRYEYLMRALPKTNYQLYKPRMDHPMCNHFKEFLKQTYKRGVDRFKAYICIGSSYIGKSVFFTEFVIPKEYYIYHSNNLEYNRMPDQPRKIFRIMDDIKWDQVKSTELKALLNRNLSDVNIKYGYEYIFPLIPIIILNKEDFLTFREHFSDIWQFLEMNSCIYPPQSSTECVEETEPLFTEEFCDSTHEYLFDQIIQIDNLILCDEPNINSFIKKRLDKVEGYYYNNRKYLQLPVSQTKETIPNPEIEKNKLLRQYNEFLLRKKKDEMKNYDEKKPKMNENHQQQRLSFYNRSFTQPFKRALERSKTKFDNLESKLKDENSSSESEKSQYGDGKWDNDDNESFEDMSEYDSVDSSSEMDSSMENESEKGEEGNGGFIEL